MKEFNNYLICNQRLLKKIQGKVEGLNDLLKEYLKIQKKLQDFKPLFRKLFRTEETQIKLSAIKKIIGRKIIRKGKYPKKK